MLRFFNIEAEVCWQSSCWTYSAVHPGVGTLSCLHLWDAVKSPLRKLSGIARKVLCTAKTEVSWGEKTRRPDVMIFIWAWIYAPSLLETWLVYVIMTRPYVFSLCPTGEDHKLHVLGLFFLIYDRTTNIIGLMLVVLSYWLVVFVWSSETVDQLWEPKKTIKLFSIPVIPAMRCTL